MYQSLNTITVFLTLCSDGIRSAKKPRSIPEMASPQRKIFISYRRQDNAEFVERIRDWFIMKYGRANVFMDFDTIPPMVKFADYIRQSIEACDAMLVIIGPHWLKILQERLQNADEDFVRTEISMG